MVNKRIVGGSLLGSPHFGDATEDDLEGVRLDRAIHKMVYGSIESSVLKSRVFKMMVFKRERTETTNCGGALFVDSTPQPQWQRGSSIIKRYQECIFESSMHFLRYMTVPFPSISQFGHVSN